MVLTRPHSPIEGGFIFNECVTLPFLSLITPFHTSYPRACGACQQTTVPPDGQICPQITESRGKMIRHSITTPAQVCHKLIMSFPEKSLRNVPANDADFCHGRSIAIGRRTLRMYKVFTR